MGYAEQTKTVRHGEYGVSKMFTERWSPRAMTGERISREELMRLFEAARWAPSSSNEQPWRAIYALRETPQWEKLFKLMVDFNKEWTERAAALVVFFSKDTFKKNGKPNPTHSFDTGSAWMSFAFEGYLQGYVVHGMAGFDYEGAKRELNIAEGYTIEAMAAVGKYGAVEKLSETLRDREKPSIRGALVEFVAEGEFNAEAQ